MARRSIGNMEMLWEETLKALPKAVVVNAVFCIIYYVLTNGNIEGVITMAVLLLALDLTYVLGIVKGRLKELHLSD